jgi:hypothetical protein
MADHPTTSDKHPPIPGTSSLGWFAVFIAVFFIAVGFFLQSKFGTPAP